MSEPDEDPPEYASPACSRHEIDRAYFAIGWPDPALAARRTAERQRLVGLRQAMSQAERAAHGDAIMRVLDEEFGKRRDEVVSGYWPLSGEPDLRPWMADLDRRGVRCALPVVETKGQPLVFRAWKEGDALARDASNIPVPADGPAVVPTFVLAPVVGFDRAGFRLGYGGGYFDRTLAALSPRPWVIGVGYRIQQMETIEPQWHDIPMDMVATEEGVVLRRDR